MITDQDNISGIMSINDNVNVNVQYFPTFTIAQLKSDSNIDINRKDTVVVSKLVNNNK